MKINGSTFVGHNLPLPAQINGENSAGKTMFFITPKIKNLSTKNPDHAHCWRGCGNMSTDQYHIFWDWPVISPYWTDIISAIKTIFYLKLDLNFKVAYLGNLLVGLNKSDKHLL